MGRRVLALTLLFAGTPALAQGQEVPLARIVSNALASAATIARPLTGSTATAQGDAAGHFYQQALRQKAPAELDASISTQLTTFPTAFAWGAPPWDVSGRTDARLRGTGSSWVESPATLGRGRVSFTAGHEAVEFGRVDGADLRGASLAVWTAHDDCCAPIGSTQMPVFERDLLEQRVTLDVDRNAYALYGAVGVTDRLDVGVMVPFVDVKIDTRVMSRIIRTSTPSTFVYGFENSTGQPQTVPHAYDAIEIANRTTYYRGDATGVGDVLLKAKYRVAGQGDGVALSLGAYLPTGDPDRLLGAGAFRGDVSLLLSRTVSRFSPHLNVGYTYAAGQGSSTLDSPIAAGAPTPSSADLPDILHVVAGADWAPHRRVMFGLDVMGRRLSSVPRFSTTSVSIPVGPTSSYTGEGSLSATGSESVLQTLGLASARVFVANHVVCTLEVMLPLNDQGLQARTAAVFGLSWGF